MKETGDKIKLHIKEEERNIFKDDVKRRHRIEARSRTVAVMSICMIIIFMIVIVLPNRFTANTTDVSLAWILDTVKLRAGSILHAIGSGEQLDHQYVIFRFLITALVGAALSISGAVYQGSLRNSLASPSTLGVQSGGVLGGTIYVIFFATYSSGSIKTSELAEQMSQMNIFERYAQTFSILLGCFLGVAVIIAISTIVGRGKVSSLALVLCGTVFGSLISGAVGLVQYYYLLHDLYGTKTYVLRYLMLGTFDNVMTLEDLALIGIPIIIGMTAVILLRNKLNILCFGEDEAKAMGMNVKLVRYSLIAIVTAMTAIVISFCGQIGFVGFIIPHVARRLVGADFKYLVPASAILGATIMMLVYYVGTALDYAQNINFVTSLVGGTLFLIMVVKYRKKSNADWA